MSMVHDGEDPRLQAGIDPLALDREAEPVVGRPPGGASPMLIGGVFVVAAVALFLVLNARRIDRANDLLTTPATGGVALPPPPPLEMPAPPPLIPTPALFEQGIPAPPPPPPAAIFNPALIAPPVDMLQRRRAPAVVVDLQPSGAPSLLQAGMATPAAAAVPAAASTLAAASQIAAPRGADTEPGGETAEAAPQSAVASQLNNLSDIITQGAIIPGVLETALSSDLPGYARAVVSRDVRSFDGRAVLIARGSRLIGQYRSAVSLGQSRVFVIWTRVIRPDGVSIQIGSPGADALGRGGLQGEVNSHFFSRFGGSILLSVLNAGVAAVSRTPATQITIGSPAAAAAAAGSASFGAGNVAPTISIRQGEAIRIFVARDLDFSGVKPIP